MAFKEKDVPHVHAIRRITLILFLTYFRRHILAISQQSISADFESRTVVRLQKPLLYCPRRKVAPCNALFFDVRKLKELRVVA